MQCCDSLYGHLIDLSMLSREKSWLTKKKGLLLPVLPSLISQLIHSIEQLGWDERKVTGMTITRAQLEAGWQLSGKLWCEAQTLTPAHEQGFGERCKKWESGSELVWSSTSINKQTLGFQDLNIVTVRIWSLMKLTVLVKEGKWSILGSLIWHKIDRS